ncbi:uncharacterized protein LOC132309040 [Cornus florida]|uniref:uncharacterized protein LOC132309040 n=1 Tax=Cornus florida TaxID=4283 RepID=UPI00289DD46E|nr:uncharacterized protein LOC132309040 [Cornus florida]
MLKLWCVKDAILPLIQQAWDIEVEGAPINRLSNKLRNVKKAVKEWNKNGFGDVGDKVIQSTLRLETVHDSLRKDPSDILLDEEQTAREEYEATVADEEILVAQKSRLTWLRENDRCTAYFHQKLKKHRNFNAIIKMENDEGEILVDPKVISDWFVTYNTKFFIRSASEVVCDISPRYTLDNIKMDLLEGSVTYEEVKAVVMNFAPDKAPGPDRFPTRFTKPFGLLWIKK